jgi:hypothetical protein
MTRQGIVNMAGGQAFDNEKMFFGQRKRGDSCSAVPAR